jgi:hypothetical protein
MGMLILHAIFSMGLIFMRNRRSYAFGSYWMVSQVNIFLLTVSQLFYKDRFEHGNPLVAIMSRGMWGLRLFVDILQIQVVSFRFYKLYNPFHLRLKKMAAKTRGYS